MYIETKCGFDSDIGLLRGLDKAAWDPVEEGHTAHGNRFVLRPEFKSPVEKQETRRSGSELKLKCDLDCDRGM